jgi:hypothetical protein
MFRCADLGPFAGMLMFAACNGPMQAHAQSIGDYSRAQRAVIESTIARSGVRPPVALPSLPAPALPANPGTAAPALPPLPPPAVKPAEPPAPDITVTGVIFSPTLVLTEVLVDGTPFLLSQGQRVPGTRWLVSRVEAEQVVLSAEPRPKGAKPATRTFPLSTSGS